MEFLQGDCLVLQIRTDGFGHAGFRSIGSGHANGSYQATVHVMENMVDVTIHADTATFASMPHLPILHADPSIFSHAFDERGLPFLLFLDILRFDSPGYLQILLSFGVLLGLWQAA